MASRRADRSPIGFAALGKQDRHERTFEGHPHPAAYTHHDAEIARIEHVLRHHGVLTRARLREYTGAEAWRGNGFEAALADAVRAGRVRELTPAASLVLRALSWRFVLGAALPGVSFGVLAVVRAAMIGVLASAIVPGRVGEAARAWVMARHSEDPRRRLPVILGTIFSQTLLNVVALAVLAALTFGGVSVFHGREDALAAAAADAAAVVGALLAGPWLLSLAGHTPSRRVRTAAAWMVRQSARARRGLWVFADVRRGPPAVVLQLAAWALQLAACYIVLLALHLGGTTTALTAAAILLAVNVTRPMPDSRSSTIE